MTENSICISYSLDLKESGDVHRLKARIQALSSELEELEETSESKISRLTEERDAARADHERLTSGSHTHTHTHTHTLTRRDV